MKKLATILALSGIVANLGLASFAFAQDFGNQEIICNPNGSLGISSVNATVTFEPRSVNFYAEPDAPLNVGSDLVIDVTDTRGYDPGFNIDCNPPGAPDAQEDRFALLIQSPGLANGATTLDLKLGTAITPANITCYDVVINCAPRFITDLANAMGTTEISISTAQSLVQFEETYSGTARITLSTNNLEVTAPGAAIPTGTYTGTITFSLV